jgi:hypothetical protein
MFRGSFVRLVTVITLAAVAAPSRAEEVDKLLYRQTRKMFETIAAKKAGVVGVLKFRASKASEPETFFAGPINIHMAEMLEAVLIAGRFNLDQGTKIVRNASLTASSAGQKLNYLNPVDRTKLFNLVYTEAEGASATPEMFFTGVVKLDQKTHQTTVVIEAFDKQGQVIEEIARFTADTDRNVIGDFGQAYILARRDVFARPDSDGNVAAESQNAAGAAAFSPNSRAESLAVLRMTLNNQAIPFESDPAGPSPGALKFTCREPLETDTVQFAIENVSKDARVACVLRINGESTLFRERDAAVNCRKWIINPGETKQIGGFYEGEIGKNMRKFVVKSSPNADEPLSPSLQGTIDFHVFVEDNDGPARADGQTAAITRGLPTNLTNYADLNRAMLDKSNLKLKQRGIILAGSAEQGLTLKSMEFLNPKEQAHWFIRYQPKKD